MQQTTIIGVIAAIISGVAIGTQSTLTTLAGRLVGPIGTGLLINLSGGIIAGVLLGLFSTRLVTADAASLREAAPRIVVAGAMGVGIIVAIAFSFARTGIAAGSAAVVLGQMVVAITVDTFGWAGAEPIPFSISRIAGLLALAVAIRLLLPSP